jgi:MFS family permease
VRLPGDQPAPITIPPLIRRNTLLLAVSQALNGAGSHLVFALTPLIVVALTGSANLIGLTIGLIGVSRFLIAYPMGRVTDVYGRKPGMLLGLMVGVAGGVLIGLATLTRSFPLFLLGMIVFGMGMNGAQQLRVAAADMYPPSRRAEGLGWVLSGTMLGVFGGPLIVTTAQLISQQTDLDPLGIPWFFLPLLVLPGMACILMVRPDPMYIATHLEEFYPAYRRERRGPTAASGKVSFWRFLGNPVTRVAMISNFSAFGVMAAVMVTTSLSLHDHGHGLPEISVSQSMHSLGMWAFSLPLGKLTDRLGRRRLMLPGAGLELLGGLLVVLTPFYWSITLGTFLVGFGWACINVASTALIADATPPEQRGRAVGANDTVASCANMILPMVAGPLASTYGLPATAWLVLIVMGVALLMLFSFREPTRAAWRGASPRTDRAGAHT